MRRGILTVHIAHCEALIASSCYMPDKASGMLCYVLSDGAFGFDTSAHS